jgi:hypothetical protein
MIDGNMIALSRYEKERERAEAESEARNDFIDSIVSDLNDIATDTTDEDIRDRINELIDRLESER